MRDIQERIAEQSVRAGDCLIWMGSKDKNGYGLFALMAPVKRTVRLHRLVYELRVGPIPRGRFVCHRCDNPSCIEPKHLFAGTPKQNTQDMLTKGRRIKSRRDATHHNTKISHAERAVVRARRAEGESYASIAGSYGVSKALIAQICWAKGAYSEQAEAEAMRLAEQWQRRAA